MKLNNKGFAISSIMYLILIMAVLLILVTLSLLGNRKLVLDKLKDSIKGEIYTELAEEQFNRLYERLDYIESTGTQYIDTGVVPTDTTGVKIDIMTTTKLTDQVFFGSRTTTDGRFWVGRDTKLYYGWNTVTHVSAGSNDMSLYSIKFNYLNDRTSSVNDSYTSSITTTLASNTKSIYLFAGNDNGTVNYYSQIRVYSFQITQDSKVVRDLIPCYRKSDRTIGMYDKINDVFYTNKGTGNFIPGPTSSFSDEYQEVEYILSTGTQYIDIDYYPSSLTGIFAEYQFTNLTVQQRLFGIDSDSTSNKVSFGYYINGSSMWAYAHKDGAGNWKSSQIAANTNKHTLYFDSVNNKINIDSGSTYSATIDGSITNVSNYSLTLFARNNMGTIDHYGKIKLYGFIIYDSSKVTKNFIPCYRKSDNVIGLYDTVEGRFYTNSGTGTFGKGSNINK